MTEAFDAELPLIKARNLIKHFTLKSPGIFGRKRGDVHALNDVSFDIFKGETLAIVGESGCGKSTLARVLSGLYKPNSGTLNFSSNRTAQNVQMIFQDPFASLNPKLTIGDIISEPLVIKKNGSSRERRQKTETALENVSLQASDISKYPHQFSGGQRQRIAIARALIADPEFIIADEPLSALDVSIQSQILNLLMKLKSERNLTYLFISHDLAAVGHVADRVFVMYMGKIVEFGPTESIFENPQHPYTKALLAATPVIGRGKRHKSSIISGESANPLTQILGCRYHPRCSKSLDSCEKKEPILQPVSPEDLSQQVACPIILKR